MTCTADALTGLMLPETLNKRLACWLAGKVKLEIPLLVVTASEVAMPAGPRTTA